MDQQFLPSCINVIDESIMEWFNKWATGFMCFGRKPHPFGIDQHTMCYSLTSILWKVHIMEGKYMTTQLGKKKWEELGKTVGLILRMYEPIFSTGKCIVIGSVF